MANASVALLDQFNFCRLEVDRMREDGRIRFAKEIRERVDGLRDAVRSVKGELLGKGIFPCIMRD